MNRTLMSGNPECCDNLSHPQDPWCGSYATKMNRVEISSSTSVNEEFNYFGVVPSPGAPVTLTLQEGSIYEDKVLFFKDDARTANTYPITIVPSSGNTIEGESSIVIDNPGGGVSLFWVGEEHDWKVVV